MKASQNINKVRVSRGYVLGGPLQEIGVCVDRGICVCSGGTVYEECRLFFILAVWPSRK